MEISIIYGTNKFLIEDEISNIKKTNANIEINKINGLNITKSDLLMSPSTMSMFSSKKIEIIYGFLGRLVEEEKTGEWDGVLSDLSKIDSENQIFFIEEFEDQKDINSFQKKKIINDFNFEIKVLNTPVGKGSFYKIRDWVSEREKYYKLSLSDHQKNLILNESNRDFFLIENELQKFALFSQGEKISDDDFNKLTSLSRNYGAFDLLDNFFSNNNAKVSSALSSLIESGININEMIGLINSELHKIFEIKFLLQEKSLNKDQIQDKTGIRSPYYFEKMLKTANNISLDRAYIIQKKLLEFDLKSKSVSFNQDLEFELLLLLN